MTKEQEQLIESFRMKALDARRKAERLQRDIETLQEVAINYEETVDKLKQFFESTPHKDIDIFAEPKS